MAIRGEIDIWYYVKSLFYVVLQDIIYMYLSSNFFQIFTHSINAIDVTSVTPIRLNSIDAIGVKGC